MRLLVLLTLANWPRFYLVLKVSVLGLTVNLAISRAELIDGEIDIG